MSSLWKSCSSNSEAWVRVLINTIVPHAKNPYEHIALIRVFVWTYEVKGIPVPLAGIPQPEWRRCGDPAIRR